MLLADEIRTRRRLHRQPGARPGQTVPWYGVRRFYQARNFMRDAMRVGDGVLFGCARAGDCRHARWRATRTPPGPGEQVLLPQPRPTTRAAGRGGDPALWVCPEFAQLPRTRTCASSPRQLAVDHPGRAGRRGVSSSGNCSAQPTCRTGHEHRYRMAGRLPGARRLRGFCRAARRGGGAIMVPMLTTFFAAQGFPRSTCAPGAGHLDGRHRDHLDLQPARPPRPRRGALGHRARHRAGRAGRHLRRHLRRVAGAHPAAGDLLCPASPPRGGADDPQREAQAQPRTRAPPG